MPQMMKCEACGSDAEILDEAYNYHCTNPGCRNSLYMGDCQPCWTANTTKPECKIINCQLKNKADGKFRIYLIITKEEIDAAQYGSMLDMEKLSNRVIKTAKSQGYEGP